MLVMEDILYPSDNQDPIAAYEGGYRDPEDDRGEVDAELTVFNPFLEDTGARLDDMPKNQNAVYYVIKAYDRK